MMMAHNSSSLLAPQRPTRSLQPHRPTLRFWCLTPKGRGIEYVSLRGSDVFRGSLVILLAYILHLEFLCVIHYYAFIVCLFSCIELYICDSDIYVTMIYDMCALYFELFICHITCVMLICLCFCVLLRCK